MLGALLKATPDNHALDSVPSDEIDRFPDAGILADGQARVTYLNPAAEQLLGSSVMNASGHALDEVVTLQDRESAQPIPVCEPSAPLNGEVRLLARGRQWIPVQYSIARTRAGTRVTMGYAVKVRDARGLQRHIEKRIPQALHHWHPQLLLRGELIRRMWQLLKEAEHGQPHAFLHLDLDNIRAVNEQAGNSAGDLAIHQIAARLKAVVSERDTLARLGGDEFGLLLERCPVELARDLAEQLHRAVESYVLQWNRETYRLGVSIGLAHFKTPRHSLNIILSAAHVACSKARRNAGDGARIQEVALS